MKRLLAVERTPVPWQNGGGLTREVAIFPPDASWTDFQWRISIASVDVDSAFSALPGVHRTLVVLEGALQLTIDGVVGPVQDPTSLPIGFDGASTTHARVLSAPTTDLNLMVRRGVCQGRIVPLQDASGASDRHLRVLVATGPLTIGAVTLDALDTVQFDPGEVLPPIHGPACGWMISLRQLAGEVALPSKE